MSSPATINGCRCGSRRLRATSPTPIRPATRPSTSSRSRRRSNRRAWRCKRRSPGTWPSAPPRRRPWTVRKAEPWETTHSGNSVSLEQELIKAGEVNRAYRLNTEHRQGIPSHAVGEREGIVPCSIRCRRALRIAASGLEAQSQAHARRDGEPGQRAIDRQDAGRRSLHAQDRHLRERARRGDRRQRGQGRQHRAASLALSAGAQSGPSGRRRRTATSSCRTST